MRKLTIGLAVVGIGLISFGLLADDMSVKLMPYNPRAYQGGRHFHKPAPIVSVSNIAKTPGVPVVSPKEEQTPYTIQLSSYLTEIEAKNAVSKISKTETWISIAEVDGKTRYRVCSGHFQTLSEAKIARSKIADVSGIKEAFVQKIAAHLTAKN